MHAAEGADGDELRTTSTRSSSRGAAAQAEEGAVKVAKMAVNAEGEHGAKLAEHHAALALSAELHASLVASPDAARPAPRRVRRSASTISLGADARGVAGRVPRA